MRSLLVLALLLSALFVAASSPARPDEDGESWSAKLLDLQAAYGSEAWKYDVAYEGQAAAPTLVEHLKNQTTSYYGAVGLRATLKIEVYDPLDPTRRLTSSYGVTAYIPTTRGNLYAYVKREAGTGAGPSDSPIFYLDFDLDGANHVDPNNRQVPPAEPGLKDVRVQITRSTTSAPPRTELVGEAGLSFTYEIPAQTALAPNLVGMRYQQPVPDSIFRLFNDIGWDRSVLSIIRPLRNNTPVDLEYQFSPEAVGQTVELYGYVAERALPRSVGGQQVPVSAPAPVPTLPFVPGVSDNETVQSLLDNTERLVAVTKKFLASSPVDADGLVRFHVEQSALLSIQSPPAAAALAVVSPTLLTNFRPESCAQPCMGGAQFRVGATELVVPASNRQAKIDSYVLLDPALTGGGAPPPVRDVAMQANALQVYVKDLDGFAANEVRVGDAWAVVADVRSPEALSGARLNPDTRDDVANPNLLSGNLGVGPIQEQHVSFYRVLSLLYGSNDAFYTVTYGDRGFQLQLTSDPALVPPGDGGVWLNFTSRTTNYDARLGESGLDVTVVYTVAAPDLSVNVTKNLRLNESGLESIFFPLTAEQAGEVGVRVSTTTGDTLPRPRDITAVWVEKPPKKGLADRIPGPDAALVAVALAALAVALAARRGPR